MKDAALILCPAQIVQFALIGMTFLDRQSVFSLFLSSFLPIAEGKELFSLEYHYAFCSPLTLLKEDLLHGF